MVDYFPLNASSPGLDLQHHNKSTTFKILLDSRVHVQDSDSYMTDSPVAFCLKTSGLLNGRAQDVSQMNLFTCFLDLVVIVHKEPVAL